MREIIRKPFKRFPIRRSTVLTWLKPRVNQKKEITFEAKMVVEGIRFEIEVGF